MPTRIEIIERVKRQVYGGFPIEDSQITDNLVNKWLSDAVAVAAKQNYVESIKLDGISYVNNSFYTTYKGLTASRDEKGVYTIELPQVPIGVGKNEGVATLQFKDEKKNISMTAIPMSINQLGYASGLRTIPNKIMFWWEGRDIYVQSTLPIFEYTALVRMISGGDSTDLTSQLNIPDDYMPVIIDYVSRQLQIQRGQVQDTSNDGSDNK